MVLEVEIVPCRPLEDASAASWIKWKKSYGFYASAASLRYRTQENQKNHMLHVMGEVGQEIYESLEIDPRDTVAQLIAKFDKVLLPKTNKTFERFKFWDCCQKDDQDYEKVSYKNNFLETKKDLSKTQK